VGEERKEPLESDIEEIETVVELCFETLTALLPKIDDVFNPFLDFVYYVTQHSHFHCGFFKQVSIPHTLGLFYERCIHDDQLRLRFAWLVQRLRNWYMLQKDEHLEWDNWVPSYFYLYCPLDITTEHHAFVGPEIQDTHLMKQCGITPSMVADACLADISGHISSRFAQYLMYSAFMALRSSGYIPDLEIDRFDESRWTHAKYMDIGPYLEDKKKQFPIIMEPLYWSSIERYDFFREFMQKTVSCFPMLHPDMLYEDIYGEEPPHYVPEECDVCLHEGRLRRASCWCLKCSQCCCDTCSKRHMRYCPHCEEYICSFCMVKHFSKPTHLDGSDPDHASPEYDGISRVSGFSSKYVSDSLFNKS
jgi:hypothetical protein